jgi:uncharacterized protein
MPKLHHIPRSAFNKAEWRNGRGISWDIASDQPFGADQFGWRFAVAAIARSGPFSHYQAVDRVFTLIEGDGVDLRFEGDKHLSVQHCFVPHVFACDITTDCTLRGSVSRALNLFTARNRFVAEVSVINVNGTTILSEATSLLFTLQGDVTVGGTSLAQGDAAQLDSPHEFTATGRHAKLYIAKLKAIA